MLLFRSEEDIEAWCAQRQITPGAVFDLAALEPCDRVVRRSSQFSLAPPHNPGTTSHSRRRGAYRFLLVPHCFMKGDRVIALITNRVRITCRSTWRRFRSLRSLGLPQVNGSILRTQ